MIDVEERRPCYEDIIKLFELDNKKDISLYIPAVIAVEKWIEKREVDNLGKFKNYLKRIGINEPKTLSPLLGYFGFIFLDNVILFDKFGPEFKLAEKLKTILFPWAEKTYIEFCKKRNWNPSLEKFHPKYRNIKIDTLVLWCHIYYKNDIFVTRDKNFKRRLSKNDEFEHIQVMSPSEILMTLI